MSENQKNTIFSRFFKPSVVPPKPDNIEKKHILSDRYNNEESKSKLSQVASRGCTETEKNWLQRLKSGLSKTSSNLTESITTVLAKRQLDPKNIENLEDLLIQADFGIDTTSRIIDRLSSNRYDRNISEKEVREVLASEIETILEPVAQEINIDSSRKPHVILMVGVNGTGKTTTIGKFAAKHSAEGKKILMVAGDTFRAAAIEQLQVWGNMVGCEVVQRDVGTDAAGLGYDALTRAKAEGIHILMMDTAGRLQNKAELMDELEKVIRVMRKVDPTAPHDVLLTIDATTGQNALKQVEVFRDRAGITGLVMTKLDGTSNGGILVAIAAKYKLPVYAIGVGEGIEDLAPFNAKEFAQAIALN
ncbi:MAG: Signal recognition particle receptor FtsY [Hyphomicrobiaceae bacterium hypho_1]